MNEEFQRENGLKEFLDCGFSDCGLRICEGELSVFYDYR